MNFHVSLTLQFLLVLMALFTYRVAVRFYCQKGDKLSTRTLKFLDDLLLPLDSKNKAAIVLLLVLADILIIKTFPLSTLLLMYTFCLVYFAKELCRDVLPSLHETVVAWGDYVTTILDTLLEVTVEGFVWWVVVFPLDQCFGVFFKFFLTMILGYRARTRIDRMDASPLLGSLTLGRIARTGCLLVFFLDPLYSLHASLSAYIVNEGLVQVLPQRFARRQFISKNVRTSWMYLVKLLDFTSKSVFKAVLEENARSFELVLELASQKEDRSLAEAGKQLMKLVMAKS